MTNQIIGGGRAIHWDCIIEMDKLIAENIKVDAIICDPPY